MGNTPIVTEELKIQGQDVEALIAKHIKQRYPQYKGATIEVNGIMATVKVTIQYRDDNINDEA